MKIIETKVFQYDELDWRAQERARNWYAEGIEPDLDYVLEAAVTAGDLLGISLKAKDIQYEVGWSQGCGAGFSGTYKFQPAAIDRVKAEFPEDTSLLLMADQLEYIQGKLAQRSDTELGEHLTASIYCSRRGYGLDVSTDYEWADEDLESIFGDFAHWIYCRLQAELEYQYSQEVVEDNIRANEYTFTETGQRWG